MFIVSQIFFNTFKCKNIKIITCKKKNRKKFKKLLTDEFIFNNISFNS